MGTRGTRTWRDGVGTTGIKGIEDLIDALAGNTKTTSDFRGAAAERVKLFVCGARFIGICRSGRERLRPFG